MIAYRKLTTVNGFDVLVDPGSISHAPKIAYRDVNGVIVLLTIDFPVYELESNKFILNVLLGKVHHPVSDMIFDEIAEPNQEKMGPFTIITLKDKYKQILKQMMDEVHSDEIEVHRLSFSH